MGKPIVVFGSFVVDLTGRTDGLPLPGQTILGKSFKMGAGGKGSNQAVAAHRAGADVTLVTKLGNDMLADVALDFYEAEGMCTDYILRDEESATGVALIIVDEATAQNEIVVIPGACNHITRDDVEKCRTLIEQASIILLQHEINADAQSAVIDIAYQAGVQIILNPAPAVEVPGSILSKIDIITPNETEAQVLTGVEVHTYETAERAAQVFLKKGVKNVVITMGAMGAFATDGTRSELVPRIKVDAIDTTGAGDAFNGGFAMALAEGKNLFEALRYGNATGALAVTKTGTAPAMPKREEIEKLLREN
ncbi:ribokinase [Blautia schinkii]|nr:ribokinase [Blautia schinkii]